MSLPPPDRYRLICTLTTGTPERGAYRYRAESHADLDTLLLALAQHRAAEWDAITIGPPFPQKEVPHASRPHL